MGSLQEGDKQEKHTKAHNDTTHPQRSEERFSRNAETDLVCRLLLEKKRAAGTEPGLPVARDHPPLHRPPAGLQDGELGVDARLDVRVEAQLLLFFRVIGRPPRSPLFPYTTLFRSNGKPSRR